MVSTLSSSNYFSEYQSAYLHRRSSATQLIQYTDLITNSIARGEQVDCIYLDYAKAFDSIIHSKLLYKLKAIGFNANLYKWIESFLSDRLQCVKVGESFSPWSLVRSGVPQGSVLGPILFLIFINDMPKCCLSQNCNMFIFADDVKCLSIIKALSDCENLQKYINDVATWSNMWQLKLSINKCSVISFNLNSELIPFQYSILNQSLNRVSSIKDLGISDQIKIFQATLMQLATLSGLDLN